MTTSKAEVPPDEVRLAVAMRGGVSLAVYMGGACSELARLQRGREGESSSVYAQACDALGVRKVELDVLSGTSAGGLNGALLATAMIYGLPFDHTIRNLWLQLGDIEALTRSPSETMPPSLLRGDDVFYSALRRQLSRLVGDGTVQTKSPVRLILTATRLSARSGAVHPVIGPPLPVGESRAHFRFRHAHAGSPTGPGGALSDFGRAGDARDATLDCLAYAARTTSSYPGAFEPALVRVARPDDPADDRALVDMAGVSSERGHPDHDGNGCAELVDGGVLDNIPVAWSVRAIASAPARKPVDRWLVYLQPVPPSPSRRSGQSASRDQRRFTRLLRLLSRALTTKVGSESIVDDAAEMRAAAENSMRARTAEVAPALGASLDDLYARAARELDRYLNLASRAEGIRMCRLLEDPLAIFGADPLPLPATLPYPSGETAGRIQRFLEACRAAPPSVVQGSPAAPEQLAVASVAPVALARGATMLLGWIRRAEDSDHAVPPEHRAAVYSARFMAECLVAVRDRLALSALAAALRSDSILSPQCVQSMTTAALAGLLSTAPTPTIDAPPHEWDEWSSTIAARVTTAGVLEPSDATTEPGLEIAWKRLAYVTANLASSLAGVDGFTRLSSACSDPASALRVLCGYEVLLGPFNPNPLDQPTPIRLATVSAANRSPFDAALVGATTDDEEYVERKLSGNQLGNFAAFLSARWRHADWIWGRLDAARSLAEILVSPERLEAADSGALQGLLGEDAVVDDREDVADRLTRLLHVEILAEELPLLEELEGVGDLPPTNAFLDNYRGTISPSAPPESQSAVLRAVGQEKVRDLLRKRDLRRALLRLGLVAWRALQPSGERWARVPRGMFAFLKPLLCLPLLLALTAPRSTLVAGLLVVPAVAFATGDWVSLPASGLIAAGVVLAATSTAWHFWRWKWSPIAIGAGVTALVVTALVLVRDWHVDVQEGWRRAVAAALLSALSTGASLWWMAGPRRGRGWRAVILGVLLLCSGVLVFGLVFNPLSGHVILSPHLVGFLVVYLTVLGSTVGLTCFFPPPLRVDLDDTGELVAAPWTATSTAGAS